MIIAEHKDIVVITQPPKAVVPVLGSRGPMGPVGEVDPTLFFQSVNLFSELNTEQKKATARDNLGIVALQAVETAVSPQAFSACRAVSLVDGVLAYADNLDVHPVIGFTRTAVGAGEPVSVQNSGEIDGFFGLTVGLPIYLASNGTVTQTVPTTGRLQSLGISLTATKVLIQIQQPLFLV